MHIESEITRQIADLEAGRQVIQSTRGFNAMTLETFHLRSKEDAPDYRYMPDPELGAIVVTKASLKFSTPGPAFSELIPDCLQARLEELRASLPELPDEAFERLQTQYGLSARDASILVALGERLDDDRSSASTTTESTAGLGVRFFEDVAKGRDAQAAANW